MSWRMDVKEDDQSQIVLTDIGAKGACVIKSPKGKEKPIYFSKGTESRILNLLGYPSASYPDIWEVIQYNKEAPIWVSSPSKDGIYGGVLVTKTGSIPLTVGLADRDTINFAEIDYEQIIGYGDGITTNFTDTLDLLPYVNQSIDIEVDGVSINVTASDAEPEILTTLPDVGDGTLTRATGALSFTFDTAPLDGSVIKAVFKTDQSALAYFALFSAAPMDDGELGVIVTRNTSTNYFEVALYVKNNKNVWKLVNNYIVSEVSNTFDGFGKNVFIEEIFNVDHDYLYGQVNSSLIFSTYTDDTARVNLGGGDRGSTISITEYTACWEYFKSKTTYPADIFMDFSALSGIPGIFDELRTTYQRYKSYILPLPAANDVSAAIATKAGYSINNRGLSFYWNWGKVKDTYNNTTGFWTSLIGKVGVKYAQMADIYNGLAPAWVDENKHGGQLGTGILELKYKNFSEDDLQLLDTNGINPIVYDYKFGYMIASQRTAQNPGYLSDSSWIGHSRVFDYIISTTLYQILVYQLIKLNDETHRQNISALGQSILDPIVNAGILAQAAVKCDRENNTDEVLSQRKFVYQVFIKVTPFSEQIEFKFTNVGQNVDIQELI